MRRNLTEETTRNYHFKQCRIHLPLAAHGSWMKIAKDSDLETILVNLYLNIVRKFWTDRKSVV